MTAKEKSMQLFNHYLTVVGYFGMMDEFFPQREEAKKCALLTINQMIIQNGELYLNDLGEKTIEFYKKKNDFLFEVKSEIELL